jgi:pimeloyl-ACP methyl ester carboxylesterase
VARETRCGAVMGQSKLFTATDMPQRDVQVKATLNAPVDDVWEIVGDFCGRWHPALASISAEEDGEVRRFTVQGEDTIYRERLLCRNDAQHQMSYTHVEGIRDCENYQASITLSSSNDQQCLIDWQASVTANEPRLDEIAEGTRLVFETGIAALQSMLPQRQYITTFPQLSLLVAGKPGQTACIFLHGIGGNSTNWSRQLPVAARHMRAAALDFRGYGGSELGLTQSSVDDYCADILRVLDHLNAQKAVLCGLSYGSWIATSFAMRHADKLAGLILSGGCTGMSEASLEESERFRMSREMPLDAGKTPRDFAGAVVGIIASPGASQDVRRRLFDSMAAIPTATYRDALRNFTNPPEKFDFSKLTMPVLLITGELDRLATPQEIGQVADRIRAAAQNRNVQFEILPEAGHVCNVEQPTSCNALLDIFLAGMAP